MSAYLHPGVPLADYVGDKFDLPPCLSPSIAHILLTRSAHHAWHAHPKLGGARGVPSEAADVGTIAHALLLEDDRSRIVVVEADDWRTKDAKAQRDAAHAAGKVPILAHRMVDVEAMLDVAHRAVRESELAGVFDAGKAEQTLVWQDAGVWCKARPDWITDDRRIVLDYKTVGRSAEPDAFARTGLLGYSYDLQAAFGLAGLRALGVEHEPTFVFVVQETAPPYAVSFVSLSPAYLAWADQKRRHALTVWAACLAENHWPSYPSRICYAEPPAWAVGNWTERMTMGGFNEAEEGVEAL